MTLLAVSTFAWFCIALPVVVIWILGLVDIFKRKLPRSTTAAWVLIVVLLPLVGTLLYFLLRKPTKQEMLDAQQSSVRRGVPGD